MPVCFRLAISRERRTARNILLDNIKYKDRDFVLIDESHNFRYSDTQRYKLVEAFLASGPARLLS